MITVNAEQRECKPGWMISDLLADMGYVFPLLVVKKNGKLIDRGKYDKTPVQDGDLVDIVHLISGG